MRTLAAALSVALSILATDAAARLVRLKFNHSGADSFSVRSAASPGGLTSADDHPIIPTLVAPQTYSATVDVPSTDQYIAVVAQNSSGTSQASNALGIQPSPQSYREPLAGTFGVFADLTAINRSTLEAKTGGQTSVILDVPVPATWYLWGRLFYPGLPGSNDPNSFWVQVDFGPLMRFGNDRDKFRTWHWDGDGVIESGPTKPLSLGPLTVGRHTIKIFPREWTDLSKPRLDALYLTTVPTVAPNDTGARSALEPRPAICSEGDLDHDGDVDSYDVTLLQQALAGCAR